MDRPEAREIQLDLILSYRTNVALYPSFQKYFREHEPPLLAVWGRNDPFFLPRDAEAYKRDIPDAEVHFLDAGHFALETHHQEIAALMRDFLSRKAQGCLGAPRSGRIGDAPNGPARVRYLTRQA
jgi:pimeloyl-ACP methyl ester carboxylesterase